jgi:glycerol kinase
MQFVADISRMRVRVSQLKELSAFGAALSCGLGTGYFSSLEDIKNLPFGFEEYHPQMPEDQAERIKTGWKTAVNLLITQQQQK